MGRFEEVLEKEGRLVYRIKGVSMLPMLRQNSDIVVIARPQGRLKKYDVALYRRGPSYVLHRVIGLADDGYVICPPMLTFYNGAETTDEQVEHVVGKVLMQFEIDYELFRPWEG